MRKNEKEEPLELEFERYFRNKNAPILILDEKWNEIFPEHLQNPAIRSLVAELGALLKQQGRQVDELKGLKRYKSQMMQEIVENMDADDTPVGKLKRKKLDQNQKMILEVNREMEQRKEELSGLPYRIREVNTELLLESTKVCYQRFRDNEDRAKELDEDIAKLREELKYKLLEKQDREMRNDKMYVYLHSVLGPELMEKLDSQRT